MTVININQENFEYNSDEKFDTALDNMLQPGIY